jgi:hypothetical protein
MKFVDTLRELHIPYRESGHEHCRVGWIQLDCPRCAVKDHFRLGYNISSHYMNCWHCGRLNVVEVLAELSGRPAKEVARLFKDLDRPTIKRTVIRRNLKLPKGLKPLSERHSQYLQNRGYDPLKIVRLWGVLGIETVPLRLAWRLFIPIHLEGDVVSWTTRSIAHDAHVRYLSASMEEESVPHKELLYGADYARASIVVVEGPLDVWSIGPGAVATCGVGYSQKQLLRMVDYPVRTVCFDNEPKAQQRARRLADALSMYPGVTYNVTLDAKDPGSATPQEIRQLRRTCL